MNHTAEKSDATESLTPPNLARVGRKIVVMSGKGGVGKSTVAVNLAAGLAARGYRVGLLDVDLHGPSIPTMLGMKGLRVEARDGRVQPLVSRAQENLKVFSIGFLIPDADEPVIWKGPMKASAIGQFTRDLEWGFLDFLVVDCPPGTGDEPMAVIQELGNPEGALVVTTPQEVAGADVRKSVNFCRRLGLPVLGLVENMGAFRCPHCGTLTPVFSSGGGQALATQFHVPFWGTIPLEPVIGQASDSGTPFILQKEETPASQAYASLVNHVLNKKEEK